MFIARVTAVESATRKASKAVIPVMSRRRWRLAGLNCKAWPYFAPLPKVIAALITEPLPPAFVGLLGTSLKPPRGSYMSFIGDGL